MANYEEFTQFLEKTLLRPMPKDINGRTRTMAKELAEGVQEGIWDARLGQNQFIQEYSSRRWLQPNIDHEMLRIKGYWARDPNINNFCLQDSAFELLNEAELNSIFISYKRSESSAFAMYVLTRLKIENLEAFVDMSLIPGEDWHAGLKERIKEYDYLVSLIGKETLKSDVCIKELGWAIEAGLTIIPIWHNGFKYQPDTWDLPPKVVDLIGATHAIEVKEESASGYNTAMVELLNRFGITP